MMEVWEPDDPEKHDDLRAFRVIAFCLAACLGLYSLLIAIILWW